jgi:hypothetical protein
MNRKCLNSRCLLMRLREGSMPAGEELEPFILGMDSEGLS